jgi:outer membrane immunogenic protein
MINKSLFSATAIALMLAAQPAGAADLPSRKAPPVYMPPPPVFTWTGFYAGLNLGGGWLDNYNRVPSWGWTGFGWVWNPGWGWGNRNGSQGGVVGGGQAGYNYQFLPWLVVGLETDFQGTSIGSGNGNNGWGWWGGGSSRRVDWFGTVRGRIGVTPFDPHFLIYGTGGFAYGDIGIGAGGWLANNLRQTGTGWTAGGGVEWAFMPNWSAKVEYLFTNIGANNWGGNWSPAQRVHIHTVRAGVNYHFNLFTPSPIVAKY